MSSYIPFHDAITLLQAANLVDADHLHLPNAPFLQPQDSIWLSVDAYSQVLDMLDIGGNAWQEQGQVVFYCCTPEGTGTDAVRSLAKSLVNIYRNLPARNPFYLGCSIGSGGMSDDGSYYVLPVTVSFRYQD